MAYNVYKSTDTGAPAQLFNTAGRLVDVLDGCLVNGYSPGTVSSITRSGSTATLTFSSAHGMTGKGNRLTIAGVDQTEYNGTYVITVVNTTQISYTISGAPVTPATGTITATKPGAGWTIAYTGTNLRAYRASTGNQRYLRVDDTTLTYARVVGYETMSDINTGTGPFPTATQLSGGLYWLKSNGASLRAWLVIATETYFIYRVFYDGANYSSTFFGDFTSYLSTTDNYNTLIIGENASGVSTQGELAGQATSMNSPLAGHYCPRSYTQTGTSITIGKTGPSDPFSNASSAIGAGGSTYPDPVSGKLLLSPIYICEASAAVIRGAFDGIIAPLHNKPLADLDSFVGDGDYAGMTFLAVNSYPAAQVFIRII